ncbi:MAG: hypothetical protein R2932_30825 [Caldilineaceae bacterium]
MLPRRHLFLFAAGTTSIELAGTAAVEGAGNRYALQATGQVMTVTVASQPPAIGWA